MDSSNSSVEIVPGMDLVNGPTEGEPPAPSTALSETTEPISPLSEVSPTININSTTTISLTNGSNPCLPMEGGIYEGGEYRYRGVDLSTLEVTPAGDILLPLVHPTVIEALYWAQKRSPEFVFPQATLVEALRNTMRQIGLVRSENLLDLLYQNGVFAISNFVLNSFT